MTHDVRFYVWEASRGLPETVGLADGFTLRAWRFARDGAPPRELPGLQNRVWWVFDRLGVFANRACGVLMLHAPNGELAHSLLVTPRYFRFPDMSTDDLQIGATWTAPSMRGRGLAKAAIGLAHQAWQGQFQRMWYLTDAGNRPSVAVIEAIGYECAGVGARRALPGLGMFGKYRLTDRAA